MHGQYPPGFPPGQFQGGFQMQQQYPQGFAPTQAPGPTNMPAPPPPGGGFHIPSADVIQSSYQKAQEIKQKILQAQSGGFSKLRFFEILGPNGQKWKSAFTGYTGAKALYIMPSWKEGAMNYIERVKHFWKSQNKPQGTSINGAGDDSLISKAYKLALERGIKSPWCRPQKLYVYQGFPYEYDLATGNVFVDPSQCMHEDGTIRPLLLEAVSTVHTAIQDLAQARQFVQMFHPDFGRPILVKKTKTGAESRDVDYSVLDLNQQPLADAFRPGLGYLYQLDELFKPATVEEQIQAIMDSGLPMPPEAGGYHGQAQTGFQGQQFQGQPQQQMQMPQGMPQMQQQFQGQPSYQQLPNAPQPNPYVQQQFQQPAPQQGNWPPPQGGMPQQQFGQGPQFQQPQFQGQQQFQQPKPLPPPPPGAGAGMAGGTPMIQPGQMQQMQRQPLQAPPGPQGGFPGPQFQGQPQMQQPGPQGSKPLTPEDLQAQMMGGGEGTPF